MRILKYFFTLLLLTTLLLPQVNDTTNVEVEILTFDELMKLGLEELVKIDVASMTSENIFTTPSTISVIDKEMILKYNFQSVSEALEIVPGFAVMRTYLKRNLPVSRGILQDHYANKVLVLINGVPVWNAVTGEGNLDRINIHNVSKIEILKGPASVNYGTNAYSGAINIVMNNKDQATIGLSSTIGNNGLFSSSGSLNYLDGDFSLYIAASSQKEDGEKISFTDDKKIAGNIKEYINAGNFTLNTSYKASSFLINLYSVDESYLGVSPRFSSGTGKNHDVSGILANYALDSKLNNDLGLKFNLFYDRNQRELSRSADDNTRAEIDGERYGGNISLLYNFNENLNLQAGLNYELKNSLKYNNFNVLTGAVLEENNMKNKSVYDYGVFSQLNFKYSAFNFLFGMRYNKNEFFGGDFSPRATLVYQINNTNSVKFVYGSSYRAPSLFELYFKTSTNTVLGNLELDPEKSNSFELIYLTTFDKFFIQLLGYYSDYSNKIFRVTKNVTLPNGTTLSNVSIYANGGKFTAKGLELELKYILKDNFTAFINYAYVSGDKGDELNNNNHYNFKYVSEHSMDIGLDKKFEQFGVSAILSYMSEQGAPVTAIDPSVILNLNFSYNHIISNYSLRHQFSVKNLFNSEQKFPEFVGRTLNDIPSGYYRKFLYTLSVTF